MKFGSLMSMGPLENKKRHYLEEGFLILTRVFLHLEPAN
jgi:hypothetical protein